MCEVGETEKQPEPVTVHVFVPQRPQYCIVSKGLVVDNRYPIRVVLVLPVTVQPTAMTEARTSMTPAEPDGLGDGEGDGMDADTDGVGEAVAVGMTRSDDGGEARLFVVPSPSAP